MSVSIPQISKRDEIRFWEKVDKSGDCWEWTAYKTYGYGKFGIGSRVFLAHRVSYSISNPEMNHGLMVCHKCDNPGCVNPSHLFQGTAKDNALDMSSKLRSGPQRSPGKYPKGDNHPSRKNPSYLRRGVQNNMAKISESEVIEIRALHEMGSSYSKLAKFFKLNKSTVGDIVLRKTWRHVL